MSEVFIFAVLLAAWTQVPALDTEEISTSKTSLKVEWIQTLSLWNSLPQVYLPFRTLCLAATAGQIPMHRILCRESYVVQDTGVVRETVCSLGYCIPRTHERKDREETPHGYHHRRGDVVSGTGLNRVS